MTLQDLFKCYRIKLPHELGKPLYIQPIDAKKQFFKEVGTRIGALIFVFFGASIALIMAYSAWKTHNLWHGAIAVLFSFFLIMLYALVQSFLHVTLYVVADKGIARYTLHVKGYVTHSEVFYFSSYQYCEVKEGYVDPHSPVSKKGYKIEAIWYEDKHRVFTMSYLKDAEPSSDKQALEEAIKAFQIICIRNKIV